MDVKDPHRDGTDTSDKRCHKTMSSVLSMEGDVDAHEMTLLLVYQHAKGKGMTQLCKRLHELGVSAGVDVTDMNCNIGLEEIVETCHSAEKTSRPTDPLLNKFVVPSRFDAMGYAGVTLSVALRFLDGGLMSIFPLPLSISLLRM